jgi:predicted nucleotidyltransferase
MNIEKWQNVIKNEVKKVLPNATIFLFGSRSRGDNSTYSDIDIALRTQEAIDFQKLALIKFNIEETSIPYKVDLVDLNNISEVFLSEIEKDLTIID